MSNPKIMPPYASIEGLRTTNLRLLKEPNASSYKLREFLTWKETMLLRGSFVSPAHCIRTQVLVHARDLMNLPTATEQL
jgi:hypothetical protein